MWLSIVIPVYQRLTYKNMPMRPCLSWWNLRNRQFLSPQGPQVRGAVPGSRPKYTADWINPCLSLGSTTNHRIGWWENLQKPLYLIEYISSSNGGWQKKSLWIGSFPITYVSHQSAVGHLSGFDFAFYAFWGKVVYTEWYPRQFCLMLNPFK